MISKLLSAISEDQHFSGTTTVLFTFLAFQLRRIGYLALECQLLARFLDRHSKLGHLHVLQTH